MPGISQLYPALVVHQRRPGIHAISQLGFCKDDIQSNQHIQIQLDVLPMGCRFRGQLRQNPLDFLLLLQFQFTQCVVGINSGHGLDEKGRSAGRNVMYQTRHIVAALGFHGYHIPSVPDGDNRFPEELGIGRRRNNLLQAVPNLGRLNPHMTANVCKGRAGRVSDFLFGENRTKNPVFQVFVGAEGIEQGCQNGLFIILGDVALDGSGRTQHRTDAQQLDGLQAAAPVCPFQGCRHIPNIRKTGISLLGTQRRCSRGFVQQRLHILQIRGGAQSLAAFLTLAAAGAVCQQRKNLIQFQFV